MFPQARVLYIERAPEDVALSLVTRDRTRYDRPEGSPLARERVRFQDYLALWEEYARRAKASKRHALTWVEARYETFVRSPGPRLREILELLALPVPAEKAIHEMVSDIRPDRAASFSGSEGDPFRDLIANTKISERWSGDEADGSMSREIVAP
jgi:hypothetical protein